MSHHRRGPGHNQTAIGLVREGRDGTLNLSSIAHVDRADFHAERWRRGLDDTKKAAPAAAVGSRISATRVVCGAICLSNSSHFPLRPYSNSRKPVAFPPGRARLLTSRRRRGRGHP